MADKKMQKAVEILEAFNYALEVIRERDKNKKEIDILIIQREDIRIDVQREKRWATKELERHTEAVKIESNALITQLNNLKGELKRLPVQIKAKQDSIVSYDREIIELKEEVAALEGTKRELIEFNDGMKSDAKKRSAQLANI